MPLEYTEEEEEGSTPASSLSGSSMECPKSPISATHEVSLDGIVPLRRSTRLRMPNPKYANNLYATCQFSFSVSDPLNYEEAAEKE